MPELRAPTTQTTATAMLIPADSNAAPNVSARTNVTAVRNNSATALPAAATMTGTVSIEFICFDFP
jgi:hypothetical protein